MIKNILDELLKGNITILTTLNIRLLNDRVLYLLNNTELTNKDIEDLNDIIHICNLLYNNTDIEPLPIEDGLYDLLFEKYKVYNPNYQVGAEPVLFKPNDTIKNNETTISAISFIDDSKVEFFGEDILNKFPNITKEDLLISPIRFINQLGKRTRDTKHMYPKLVGTLDKCKFVLTSQAEEKGVVNDSNVKILERDFFATHLQMGLINMQDTFTIIGEIKYDGMSIEADVTDEIKSARTRGDANESIATDVTSILGGYRFKHAPKNVEPFGMKFEAIMTYNNLYKYNELRGKNYKNARTAISSIFSSLDGYLFRDLITLVPLATSIEGIDRIDEILFMNEFYHSGEQLRYTVIEGNYLQVLFLIKKFAEEAEYARAFMPFLYDGIVLSYTDPNIIKLLGRKNAVNKYSIAVKFNPLKKQTIFRRYEFTVGQDGSITPMIYYDPIEFYGGIHDHSTASSLDRFNKLALRVGDLLDVEYVNDVMPYVTKGENSHNLNNSNPIVPFRDDCPSCHNKLTRSKSGKSMFCMNKECPGRNTARMANMLKKLNLKDFSDESLLKVAKSSLSELLSLQLKDVEVLGEANSIKFIERMNELKTREIYDYKILGSLGFTDIAIDTWKLIMHEITLPDLMSLSEDNLRKVLLSIKGIGPISTDTICRELEFFKADLICIINMKNIISFKGISLGKNIRFTGFRNQELVDRLVEMGHDANDNAGVTKKTNILLVPDAGHESKKTKDALVNGIMIVPVNEFLENMERYL